MLDVTTLRVVFALVALTLLVLFYFAIYRTTHASYAGWWCLSLLLFVGGNSLYTADGTGWQWFTNPAGNVLVVGGTAAIWRGACSLRRGRPPTWALVAGPLVVGFASAVDSPATNTWSGGPFYIAATAVYLGLSAYDMWMLSRVPASETSTGEVYRVHVQAMAIASTLLGGFYAVRWVVYLSAGPDTRFFDRWVGSEPATLLTTVLLVVVSFSMSALSNEQRVLSLRAQATRDSLTGLLNRAEFFRVGRKEVRRADVAGQSGAVVMADLDHFKSINDRFGHRAGDEALAAFASACVVSLRATDLIGRLGGEEFAFVMPGCRTDMAERVTKAISEAYRAGVSLEDTVPTVSYGITPLERGADLDTLLARADAALYRAKAAGRDRAVTVTADGTRLEDG